MQPAFSTNPAPACDWADRLLANDPKVRATATAALVQEAQRSLPLLRQLLDPAREVLRVELHPAQCRR